VIAIKLKIDSLPLHFKSDQKGPRIKSPFIFLVYYIIFSLKEEKWQKSVLNQIG